MNKSSSILGALLALALLAVALGAVSVSLVPYDGARTHLDRSARAGVLHEYTPEVHTKLALALRIGACAALMAGLAVWRWRGRLGALCARLGAELGQGWRAVRPQREDLPALLAVLALTGLAAGLRLAFLFQPMRYDEAFTCEEYAARPVYVIVSKYDLPNNHVFHSLCVHAARALLGDAPWAVRLPAFLAGVLLVPAAYAAARALHDRATGLVCAALVAGSSVLVEYSTNARGYTLIALCFLLLVRLGCALRRHKSLLGWALFGLLAALGLWTVPTMLFPYGAVVLWLALARQQRQGTTDYGRSFLLWLAGSCLVTVVVAGILYAPVLLVSGARALTANPFVAPAGGRWWAEVPAMLGRTWALWQRDVPAPLAGAVAVGFVAAIMRPGSRSALLAWTTLGWSAAVVVIQRVVPYERVWLFALPLYLCVASSGLVWLVRLCRAPRALPFGIATAASALLAWQVLASGQVESSTETGTLREAAEVAAFLKERMGPDDRVIAWCPSDRPLEYYCRRIGARGRVVASRGWREDEPDWRGAHLLAVVNKAHGQTFAALARHYRLAELGDPDAAKLVWQGQDAVVFECDLAGRGARGVARHDARTLTKP